LVFTLWYRYHNVKARRDTKKRRPAPPERAAFFVELEAHAMHVAQVLQPR
jgi:hypothetical protein